MPDVNPLTVVLAKLSDRAVSTLYQNAKLPARNTPLRRGGLRPFFADPRNMIVLRNEYVRRQMK